MPKVSVDEKHGVTLPKDLREKLRISVETVLEVEYKGGSIILKLKVRVRNQPKPSGRWRRA